jgi:hypothetical protein
MRLICWIIELYYVFRHGALIRGHYFEYRNGKAVCMRCGETTDGWGE